MKVDFILDYKWYFFVAGEIIFWGSVIGFLLLRYVFNLNRLNKYVILLWMLSDMWLLSIGVLDYMRTGNFDTFQIVIIVAVVYAFTYGKKDIKKLDHFVYQMTTKWKGKRFSEHEAQPEQSKQYGMHYTVKQLKDFCVHLLIYTVVMVSLVVFFDLNFFHDFPTDIWSLIILIHAVFTGSYFIFPKKDKATNEI